MKRYTKSVVLFENADGKNPDQEAQVKVYLSTNPQFTTLADVFSDDAGTVSLSQPFLTNTLAQKNPGQFTFVVADGVYDIVINENLGDDKTVLANESIKDKDSYHLTEADMIAANYLRVDDTVTITDRDDALGTIKTGLTSDTFSIIESTGSSLQWQLNHDGQVNIIHYGFVDDGAKGSISGTDNSAVYKALIADQSVLNVSGNSGIFSFKNLSANEVLATRQTSPISIDWGGAYLVMEGDSTIASTDSAFLQLLDINGSMVNFEFEDIGFSIGVSVGRGVSPLVIMNDSANTGNYEIGSYHVHKGQSMLTCSSTPPFSFRASGIRMTGACTGDDVYYGVNLFGNGDCITGEYSVKKTVRLAFISSVKDVKLRGHTVLNIPTSGSVNVSNRTDGPPTENLDLYMSFDTIDGVISFNTSSDTPANDGKGTLRNINLKLYVKNAGANIPLNTQLVNFKTFDSTGSTMTSATALFDDIKLNINSIPVFTNPITQSTTSPNFQLLTINSGDQNPINTSIEGFNTTQGGSVIRGTISGDTTVNTLDIPVKWFGKQTLMRMRLEITAQESTAFFGTKAAIAVYDLMGFISGGSLTLLSVAEISKTITGASVPVFTVTANSGVKGESVNVAVSGFASNAGGEISGRLWSII